MYFVYFFGTFEYCNFIRIDYFELIYFMFIHVSNICNNLLLYCHINALLMDKI